MGTAIGLPPQKGPLFNHPWPFLGSPSWQSQTGRVWALVAKGVRGPSESESEASCGQGCAEVSGLASDERIYVYKYICI